MQDFHGYYMSENVILFLVLVHGLCVCDAEETVLKAVGDTLILQFPYHKDNGTRVKWHFNGAQIVDFNGVKIRYGNAFDGRLEVNVNDLSLTLRNLRSLDSGRFTIVALQPGKQLPTKTFDLYVHRRVENVKIQSNLTWIQSHNVCQVDLICYVPGDQSLTYSWTGFHRGDGAQLNFTLLPVDGAINQTCTASNGVSMSSELKIFSCEDPIKIDNKSNVAGLQWYMWAGVGAGSLVICVITGIIIWCYKSRTAKSPGGDNTVYADIVSDNVGEKHKRLENINCGMSVYETVGDPFTSTPDKPQTLYDTVSFSRDKNLGPSLSSPYQDVL